MIISLRNIIHRYLEETCSYRYIDQLEKLVKTVNFRVTQMPQFYIGDFVRVVKKEKAFRKS